MNITLGFQFADMGDYAASYLVLVGVFYVCVFLLGTIYLTCRESLCGDPGLLACFRRVGRLALFLLVLLVVGDFYNILWTAMIHNRLYHSPGYDGVDFVPWYPITRGLVEATYGADSGRLIGVTFFQLQVIWFVFAISTWGSTLLVFEKVTAPQESTRIRKHAGAARAAR